MLHRAAPSSPWAPCTSQQPPRHPTSAPWLPPSHPTAHYGSPMVTPRASHAHTTGALRPPQPPHRHIPVTPRPTATPWWPHSGCTATSQSKPALSVPTHGGPLGGGAAIGRGLMGPAGGLPLSGTSGDMPVVGARGVLHPQPPGGQVPMCSRATRPQRLCRAWGGQRGSAPTPHTAPHSPLCPGTRGCPRRAAQEHGGKEGAMEPTGAGDTEQCPGAGGPGGQERHPGGWEWAHSQGLGEMWG